MLTWMESSGAWLSACRLSLRSLSWPGVHSSLLPQSPKDWDYKYELLCPAILSHPLAHEVHDRLNSSVLGMGWNISVQLRG